MQVSTREWIDKAEADFTSAGREYRARKQPNYDTACFFAQQCVDFPKKLDYWIAGGNVFARRDRGRSWK